MPTGRQGPPEIGRHQRERASKNICKHQVVTGFSKLSITVSRRSAHHNKVCNPIAGNVAVRNLDGSAIDVAGNHPAAQQRSRSDR
jgi:hypothetical protein